jgi:hypothetical protein
LDLGRREDPATGREVGIGEVLRVEGPNALVVHREGKGDTGNVIGIADKDCCLDFPFLIR